MRDQVEVVDDLWESRGDVEVLIGGSVTHNETLERDYLGVLVDGDERVVLVDPPGEIGDVDPSVALTRHVQVVGKELGEACIPIRESGKGIVSLGDIVMDPVLRAIAN